LTHGEKGEYPSYRSSPEAKEGGRGNRHSFSEREKGSRLGKEETEVPVSALVKKSQEGKGGVQHLHWEKRKKVSRTTAQKGLSVPPILRMKKGEGRHSYLKKNGMSSHHQRHRSERGRGGRKPLE